MSSTQEGEKKIIFNDDRNVLLSRNKKKIMPKFKLFVGIIHDFSLLLI